MSTGIKMTDEARSKQHMRVLVAIVEYKEEHGGISPTYREIGTAVGIKSQGHVASILSDMENDGTIGRVGKIYGPRGITVPGEKYTPPDWL